MAIAYLWWYWLRPHASSCFSTGREGLYQYRARGIQIGVEASAALAQVRVGADVSECPPIDGNLDVRTIAQDYLMRTGRRCFVVVQNGSYVGLVTINELKQGQVLQFLQTRAELKAA